MPPVHPWSAEQMTNLCRLKVIGRVLAGTAILNEFVTDLLTVCQRAEASALYGRDVYENVGRAIVRLNEAEALGCVEPLYGASVHNDFLS
jgi:hypothetical protein